VTRRRARLAGLVGLVLLGVVTAAGAPAAARPSAPAGATSGWAAQPAPTLELVRQTPWVHPGEAYSVDLRVNRAPVDATLDLVVHDLLGSRAEFRDSLDGELGGTEHAVAPQPLDALTTSAGVAQIGFTPGPGGVSLPSRGVYPVEIRLQSEGETVASTVTYLTYLTPTDFPPLEVGVVVDIAAPPALQPDGATELSTQSVARAQQRVEAVEAAGTTPLTLAPLPETVEGLADAGGPDAAIVDRLRLLAATRQVLARPFVDIDLAALRDAGLESEAYQQSDGGANVARSLLAVEPAGGVWMSGATWRPEAARWAVEIGFDRAIVPSSAVGDGEEVPTTPVRIGDDGPLAVVADPDLADHLTSDDGMVAAHRLIAELTTAWLEAPSDPRAMVVHIPAGADIDPQVVGTALAALNDGQAVQGVPVTQIFSDVPPADDGPSSVELAPAERGPDLRGLAPQIESARSQIGGVAGLLGDPDVAKSLDHALFMSTGVATPDDDRAAYVDWAQGELENVEGAVSLPDEFQITLTARSSTIPVTLTNNTELDLQVRVELDSDQLEFPDGDVLTPTLPPGTTRLEVRVRARTSGAFTLAVTVSTPDDTVVLDRSTFDIRSTAISGVGLLLSVGAVLFLAIWWGRHWRRARRERRAGEPEPPSEVGPEVASAPAASAAGRVTSSLAPWAARPPAAPPPPPPGALEPPREPAPPGPTGKDRGRRPPQDEPYRPAHMARPRSRSSTRGR
jgi:Family of unknown function (DUF6049)